MGIPVLGPDVNESAFKFRVNDEGAIRFGLGAMKGVGEGAVLSIIEHRQESPYTSIFDFACRVSLKDCNKRVFESLALGGGFDSFEGVHRAQYFAPDEKGRTLIEQAVRYGNAFQESKNSAQVSLFGDAQEVDLPEPVIPEAEEWNILDKLNREREVVGIYISGHPLDDYRFEMEHFCTKDGLSVLGDLKSMKGRDLSFGGMITAVEHRVGKTGKPYGNFTIEDYNASERFFLFGDNYVRFREYLVDGWFVYVKGTVKERGFKQETGELEYRINQIELLSDLKEKFRGSLQISFDLDDLNDRLLSDLSAMLESHPGNTPVSLEIRGTGIGVSMPSRKARVDLSREFMQSMDQLEQIAYVIKR